VPLDVAAEVAGVRPNTIRQWVTRGKLTRHDDGYDLAELLAWVDQRSEAALMVRAGVSGHGATLRDA
jgi:hypothetical protein